MEIWQPAYIGVGSNLDEPRLQVLNAFERLRNLPQTRVVLTSPLYVSRPFGPVPQAPFINAVAGLLTQLPAGELLGQLRALESEFGRPEQRQRWGPRVIDLDVLVYGRERHSGADLTVPHPGIGERNFVLYPLADIAADMDIPGLGRVAELKACVVPEGLRLWS